MSNKITSHSDLFTYAKKKFKDLFKDGSIELDEVCFLVEKNNLIKFICSLRDDPELHFSQLMDITATDYPESEKRFELAYQFLSIDYSFYFAVIYLSFRMGTGRVHGHG